MPKELSNVGRAALIVAAAFAWSKLGLKTAAEDVGGLLPPTQADCPVGYVKVGPNCIPKEHLTR